MEEKTRTSSSPPTTSNHDNNPKIVTNSLKIREDGELSASENDDVAGSQLPNTTILQQGPSVEIGTSSLTHKPTHISMNSKTSVPINNRKSTEKNRVPFVISFSDDDSGSDSEEYIKHNTIESDEITKGVTDNRKLSTPLVNTQIVKPTAKNNIKIPKKTSTSRTFVSSTNRVNANASSSKNGGTGSTFVGVKSHNLKKPNPPSKPKSGPNVHINSNELQDLRQLIAFRENQLKNKAGKLDKEVALKNNMRSTGVRIRDSADRVPVEAKEPEKKRLKVVEPQPPINTIAVGQHDRPQESTLATINSSLETEGLNSKYDSSQKEIIGRTGQSSAMQMVKEVKNHNIPSTNLPSGSGIMRKNKRHNKTRNLVESCAPLMPKTCLNTQGSLNNNWNHFGPTNMSETNEMDIKSLLEIEELQEKELDEAQEHRRKCEIEERKALKAYHKAQRALAEANAKCTYLFKKRDLFSANIQSRIMEDQNTFWSNMPHQHNMLENDTPHQQEDTSGSENDGNDLAEDEQDEQTSVFELKTGESSHVEGICSERNEDVNNDKNTPEPTEDSLLLEATLRSQLFARLGVRNFKKNESGQNMETDTVEKEDGEIMEDSGNLLSSETDKDQFYDFGDIGRSDKTTSEHPMDYSVNYGSCLAEPFLRSAFGHVKFTMMDSIQSQTDDTFDEKRDIDDVCGAQQTNSKTLSLLDMNVSEIGSYSNNLAINPFWPLCMFELRGKCNDDECKMQHVRDYSSKNIDCNKNDSRAANSIPPTYMVCLDSLKADNSHPYKYLVSQTVEQRWQKYYSACLVVSSSILADLNSDEPCLHGPETRIEVHGVWNRQSSYFHAKNVKEGLPDQHVDDTYQPLEVALHNLSREVNKQKGRKEALTVLARALEEHPTSVLIWIVYLHIYYSNQKSIGKDDLFRYAIEHNESSYELWLMFINSREKLNDRLTSYNTAISALCHHTSTPNRNPDFDSECILDLFLQMLTCLCSSGQVNTAIQKSYTLLKNSTKRSIDLNPPFLPDLYDSLTVTDKRVLWICSIYLILYKKLPDLIVQQFECRKELTVIEWNSVKLTHDEKLQAETLLELANDYIDTDTDTKAKSFAINHIKCTAVIQGLDSCKNLFKKYMQLYPTCTELVLLSIRVNGWFDSAESAYALYEDVLQNPVQESGIDIQCIWNQYAENALENGNADLAKEIMERWFSSNSTRTDNVFGLLNLSLYKQLQNDHTEARIAIGQVFEAACSDDYSHCVREHATVMLKNGFGFEKARLKSFFNVLNSYLTDSRASPPPEPLSRSFIKTIKKPKTQKLVNNNLLAPVSSDSSLLNLVLESCFGPCLLSFQGSEKVTDVVDFAESLMEIRPANYRLALSICKNQSDANSTVSFWASAQVIDSLFQAVPVAPESVWAEAARLLKNVSGFESMLESFHKRALSVYPFSIILWKSYIGLYGDNSEKANVIIEMAREKGLNL